MRVVSFFAGCGGLDLGFEQSGYEVIWANEFNPDCQTTYMRNHPKTKFVLGDMNDIKPEEIPDLTYSNQYKPERDGNAYALRLDKSKIFVRVHTSNCGCECEDIPNVKYDKK